ncbi:zinc finger protein GLIS3 [Papilio machaon]|uniref:zinc finger protein GLIS3 n=1 Tax=Papilio machaon TaxID=76193 RepID=UPI001E664E3B|nr:zinc finger protein GLIS3 [Papilio machaon]
MLVFPQWRPEMQEICRAPRWMPAERFAPYLARPMLPPLPPQLEDEESVGSSSPERSTNESVEVSEGVCGWRGCGARLHSVARLSAHIARAHAHAHQDGLFYCGWKGCSRPQRGFNARYKMLVHVRTHTNERPHTCNQCNKCFSRAENLKIHLRSHSGEKPYVCPYEGCGKAYSNSSDRFKHTRTHTVDKPYCCKIPGCNKRYTDPSSLRKHVKTYKHFAPEETNKRDSSDESQHESFSPTRDKCYLIEPVSPLRGCFTYNENIQSPKLAYNSLQVPEQQHSVGYPQVTYVRPLEPIYPMRVPQHEMSYIEYTQMYEHAYRNYYSNSINYPVLHPNVNEKCYYNEQSVPESTRRPEINDGYKNIDAPLNLICSKRIDYKPIEDLVTFNDLPLDLSTKS